jgi:hypothetical protein
MICSTPSVPITELREAYQFTELGDCVLAGWSLTPDWQAQRRLEWMLLVAGSVVLALGVGGGWWLATRAIRPVEDIGAATSRIPMHTYRAHNPRRSPLWHVLTATAPLSWKPTRKTTSPASARCAP